MNYEKLVHKLRKKAYDYNDDKVEQFSRILSEAKIRKIVTMNTNYIQTNNTSNIYLKY